MRIDSFISSYTPERSARPGSAVTPFREAQREVEARRERPASPTSTQGFESVAQPRKVDASNASVELLSARQADNLYQPPLSNWVAQALTSYTTTAGYASDLDAHEIMGLDLYV